MRVCVCVPVCVCTCLTDQFSTDLGRINQILYNPGSHCSLLMTTSYSASPVFTSCRWQHLNMCTTLTLNSVLGLFSTSDDNTKHLMRHSDLSTDNNSKLAIVQTIPTALISPQTSQTINDYYSLPILFITQNRQAHQISPERNICELIKGLSEAVCLPDTTPAVLNRTPSLKTIFQANLSQLAASLTF